MLQVISLGLALLYRYYPLILESILTNFFITVAAVVFISIFILLMKNVFFCYLL